MAILASRAANHVRHALGRRMSSEIDEIEVLNAAGEWLCSSYTWNFLARPAANVDFAAGQAYAILPTDFAESLGIERNTLTAEFRETTLATLETLRAKSVLSSTEFTMWGAIAFAAGSTTTPPIPRLEIYPTPASNVTAALKVPYRAGWNALTGSDSEYVQVPEYMTMLYLESVRRTADAWEKRESLPEKLNELAGSTIMMAAMERDARHQMDYGAIMNGAVQRRAVSNTVPWTVVVT